MNRKQLAFVLLPAAVLTSSLFSRGSGTFPGQSSIPSDAARRSPSCTACHSGTIGSNGVATHLTVAEHSLALNESIQTSIQVSGGPSGTAGGFIVENSAGAFTAGSTSRVNTTGRVGQFITHNSAGHRSWTFTYAAPNTPGLIQLYSVAMAANTNGSTSGDSIAFNGSAGTAIETTPIYIGVNAAGNQRYGQGCVGSYGNWPVLYADQTPTLGNAGYALKLAGAAPASSVLFLVGLPRATPFDLTLIGANGCQMWVDALVSVSLTTSAGNAQRGEGTATLPLGIPTTASLSGTALAAQCAVVDPANGRSMPITMSGALVLTIQ